MREINGLNFEQNKKYRAAIEAGYFDAYEQNAREWQHSFVGKMLLKWPKRTKTLVRLQNIVGHIPQWSDMSDDVIDDFVYDVQEAVGTSSAKTICAELKAVLNENRRKIPSEDFIDKLTLKNERSQFVYLTRDEIARIIRYQTVGDIERYVRRNFVIECLTGARLCDARRLTISSCDVETGTLSYVPDKTSGIVVTVPVDEGMHLRDFLADKYQRDCCVDVFNDTLRRICRHVCIDEPVTLKKCGEVITAPKYELISSHTGRRSFATNLYLAGVTLEDIALMMGHGTNIDTTRRYICAERKLSRNIIAYFQPDDVVETYSEDVAC